jgi:hypothetical protein
MGPAKRLAQAVGAWLQFEFACNRSELFNERCMSASIASGLHAIYKQEVRSEYLHPVLAPLMLGRGRRPEVDFAVISRYPDITCVLESKWVGSSGVRLEDVAWDLLRLELVAHQSRAAAFFLMAGRRKHLEAFFESRAFLGRRTAAGKYRTILSLKKHPQPRIRIADALQDRKPLFRKVLELYQGLSFPIHISTSVAHVYPESCPMFQHQALVWQIHATVTTPRFLPRDHKFYRTESRPSRQVQQTANE